ncbi:MAG: DNA repair protein RecO [Rickettsiales bacterium]|jgi:DNA repair protein RecO (recombination protein O)|nr:DNA repair protein RecO [Rickettsiales bacterium]
MIKIEDEAFLLAKMKFSESSIIVSFLTKEHGILKGIIKGAFAKKNHNVYEIGNKFSIRANSRFDSGLVRCDTEVMSNHFFEFLSNKSKLLMLLVASELICKLFPENIQLDIAFDNFTDLLDSMLKPNQTTTDLYKQYFIFELMLLKEMGYGLDLSKCAVCSESNDLIFISPKTGRAVCRMHGTEYSNKIFKLPKFLLDFSDNPDMDSLHETASISEHFLNKYYFKQYGKEITYMRQVLINNINK